MTTGDRQGCWGGAGWVRVTLSGLAFFAGLSEGWGAVARLPGEFDLSAQVGSGLQWYSNLFLRDEALEVFLPVEAELVASLSPSLVLTRGDPDSIADFALRAGYSSLFFRENDDLNRRQLDSSGSFSFRGSRLTIDSSASIRDVSLPSVDVRPGIGLVDRRLTRFRLRTGYEWNDRTRFAGSFFYDRTDFPDDRAGRYVGALTRSLPVEVTRSLTEKLFAGFEVRLREHELENGREARDVTADLLLRGEVGEDAGIDLGLGAVRTVADSADERTGDSDFYYRVRLHWTPTPDTLLELAAASDVEPTSAGELIHAASGSLRGIWSITPFLHLEAHTSWQERDFPNSPRKDELLTGGLGLSYSSRDWWGGRLGLRQESNRSSQFGFTYANTVLELQGYLDF